MGVKCTEPSPRESPVWRQTSLLGCKVKQTFSNTSASLNTYFLPRHFGQISQNTIILYFQNWHRYFLVYRQENGDYQTLYKWVYKVTSQHVKKPKPKPYTLCMRNGFKIKMNHQIQLHIITTVPVAIFRFEFISEILTICKDLLLGNLLLGRCHTNSN